MYHYLVVTGTKETLSIITINHVGIAPSVALIIDDIFPTNLSYVSITIDSLQIKPGFLIQNNRFNIILIFAYRKVITND